MVHRSSVTALTDCGLETIRRPLIAPVNAGSATLKRSQGFEKVVGRVGIEPTTGRLKAECSTSELTPHLGTWMAGMPSECAA